MPAFGKIEALLAGWQLFKKNWLFLSGVTLLSLLVSYLPTYVSGTFTNRYPVPTAVFSLIFWLLGLLISIGLIQISLNLVSGANANFSDLFGGSRRLVKFILAAILVGIITLAGLVLFIIPGIFFGVRLQFTMYFVVDKNLGPLGAIRASWAATKGSVGNLILFNILLGLVSLLGVLALGVGLLITTPVTMLSMAWVFRKLAG